MSSGFTLFPKCIDVREPCNKEWRMSNSKSDVKINTNADSSGSTVSFKRTLNSSFGDGSYNKGSLGTLTTFSVSGSEGSTSDISEEIEVQLKEKTTPVIISRRSRELPGTGYYSNNHIMVNTERTKRSIPAVTRKSELDAVARSHAESMATCTKLYHSDLEKTKDKIGSCRRLGENIAKGPTIRIIHSRMVRSAAIDLENMLDERFTEMGMATARGSDGNLYLCQIFRG